MPVDPTLASTPLAISSLLDVLSNQMRLQELLTNFSTRSPDHGVFRPSCLVHHTSSSTVTNLRKRRKSTRPIFLPTQLNWSHSNQLTVPTLGMGKSTNQFQLTPSRRPASKDSPRPSRSKLQRICSPKPINALHFIGPACLSSTMTLHLFCGPTTPSTNATWLGIPFPEF